jgi:hypothetical protein
MSAEKTITRRDRVIMVLGLVALLLFAANLLTFVKHRVLGQGHDRMATMVDAVESDDDGHIRIHNRHQIVVVPRSSGHNQFKFEVHRNAEHKLQALYERLAMEAAELQAESDRLEAFGHLDAALSLRESSDLARARMFELQSELEEMTIELEEVQNVFEEMEIEVDGVQIRELSRDSEAPVVVQISTVSQ